MAANDDAASSRCVDVCVRVFEDPFYNFRTELSGRVFVRYDVALIEHEHSNQVSRTLAGTTLSLVFSFASLAVGVRGGIFVRSIAMQANGQYHRSASSTTRETSDDSFVVVARCCCRLSFVGRRSVRSSDRCDDCDFFSALKFERTRFNVLAKSPCLFDLSVDCRLLANAVRWFYVRRFVFGAVVAAALSEHVAVARTISTIRETPLQRRSFRLLAIAALLLLSSSRVQVASCGISADAISFKSLTMESEKYICVRETVNGQDSIAIIDTSNPSAMIRRPITADAAIMHPDAPILSLKGSPLWSDVVGVVL
jgi:hypothetical protein